jgi:3-hydroxy-9,10-secoandrosta-1,3,5(10)-triene-9,17-dione monooxygenase reductase component
MTHIGEDPFGIPVDQRDPARRFRGRLASPVTVWTTLGDDDVYAGITVGSMVVAEGQPPVVLGLIDPLSFFWESVTSSKRFVVHVLERGHRRLADQMAGRYPGPDARFENVKLSSSDWGPVIDDVANRAYCTFSGFVDVADSLAVKGDIDRMELSNIEDPLVYFRGSYHDLTARK